MTTVHDILEQIRGVSTDKTDLGTRFEYLMVAYLKTEPIYVDKFEDVWRWPDWPEHVGSDTGIDIVAKERDGGGLVAIQCKFYEGTTPLPKSELDKFFTASGKVGFTQRIVISTTDNWSKNAVATLEGQQIPTVVLRLQDLDQSSIDWSKFHIERPNELTRKPPKTVRPHQRAAIDDVVKGFKNSDRGKMIMACGTGKTFTALKLVEETVPLGGSVLFMVPSISLLSQSLKEWSNDSQTPLRLFAVCSDARAGRRSDTEDIGLYDLAFPASTDPAKLASQVQQAEGEQAITVVFSTYQSIEVITKAQEAGLPEFDLIVCDEAHRTTGATLTTDKTESTFVRIHDNEHVQGQKRIYMTATPRIYDEASKAKAKEGSVTICSMDDESMYGPEFHHLSFGVAVAADLLTDYKVLVLAVDESEVSRVFQSQLSDEFHELNLDDAARIVGCWNGLAKRGTNSETFDLDPIPMHRAVAFAQTIDASKKFTELFGEISRAYAIATDEEDLLRCEVDHVDGTQNSLIRKNRIDWLEAKTDDDHLCRILSNAKCLTEGVDVPALDAVMFLNPRKSIVDVVQAVGRVMRKADNKNYGYIILPIGIPAGVSPEEALANNERYRVVWQVLQALRAVDNRIDAEIHQLDFNKKKNGRIQVIGTGSGGPGDKSDVQHEALPSAEEAAVAYAQGELALADLEMWRDAIYAKLVEKVGDRKYWENWAKDIAEIAERHITRINTTLEDPGSKASIEFEEFLTGLRANLNDAISREDAIEMLAQHIITKPVFDALFEDYAFASHNPVSQVMDKMVAALDEENLNKEAASLEDFYESVRTRASGIDNAEGRQRIITELYEKFFRGVFKKTTESLGIVYTPVEIVDFIIHSVEAVLKSEFGSSLSDDGVHVLDPFTGTGTFIVRLIQSGVISPAALAEKYAEELHANELVLLAYYIAAINIESAFHEITGDAYTPFGGIVLTDTFQMFEGAPADDAFFPDNNTRAKRQREIDIRVILGNPPYSIGQGSENDNNQNLEYPQLDARIRASYAEASTGILMRGLYDSYIRAFRWSSDRIGDRGVICFVSNAGYIDTNTADGFRKSLTAEFSAIYCFNLRGNQRTSGETSRREGGKVFGEGSRTPIAITLLVKNPDHDGQAVIRYHDIGDYLTREQKLERINEFGNVDEMDWIVIEPNEAGDWINQRSEGFEKFDPLGDKRGGSSTALFGADYSIGAVTSRDAWTTNFSLEAVESNMKDTIQFYIEQIASLQEEFKSGRLEPTSESVENFISTDGKKISWSRSLKASARQLKASHFRRDAIVMVLYRPFTKQHRYFDRQWNEMVNRMYSQFPSGNAANKTILVPGTGSKGDFSPLISDCLVDLNAMPAGAQCFPLYIYDPVDGSDGSLFSAEDGEVVDLPTGRHRRRHAITDATLETYQDAIDKKVTKEDIFFYVYGLLHSTEYQTKYATDLGKMIPRIPASKNFWEFSRAGRKLAELHVNYETINPWPLTGLPDKKTPGAELRVEKMNYKKIPGMRGQKALDRSTIIVNNHITLEDIPIEAYEYQVNGKSAVDWILDRYQVKTDKESGIVNDPNDWSDDPRYIVDLVARIVRVSIESAEIIQSLPPI